jgi:hypothetical protein
MPTNKELVFRVLADATNAQRVIKQVMRDAKELAKILKDSGGLLGGGGVGSRPAGTGTGDGSMMAGSQNRFAKMVLDSANAMKTAKITSESTIRNMSDAIGRAMKEEGKAIDDNTRKLRIQVAEFGKLATSARVFNDPRAAAYEAAQKNKKMGRLSERIGDTEGAIRESSDLVDQLKRLNKTLEEGNRPDAGGMNRLQIGRTLIGAGSVITGAAAVGNFMRMYDSRIEAARASVGGGYLNRTMSGNLTDSYFAANMRDYAEKVNSARGTGWHIASGVGQILGGAGLVAAAPFIGPFGLPSLAAGTGLIGHGASTIMNREAIEAQMFEEARANSIAAHPLQAKVIDYFHANAPRLLGMYRGVGGESVYRSGRATLQGIGLGADVGDPMMQTLARSFAGGNLNAALHNAGRGYLAGDMSGGALLGQFGMGLGNANMNYNALLARSQSFGKGSAFMEPWLQAGGIAASMQIGQFGHVDPAGASGFLLSGFGRNPAANLRMLQQNQGGLNTLGALSTGSTDNFQKGINIINAMRTLRGRGLGMAAVTSLSNLDPATLLSDQVPEGLRALGIRSKDIAAYRGNFLRDSVRTMFWDDPKIKRMKEQIATKYGGDPAAFARASPENESLLAGSLQATGRYADSIGFVRGMIHRTPLGKGARDKGPVTPITPEESPERKYERSLANLDKAMLDLVKGDGGVTKAIEGFEKLSAALLAGKGNLEDVVALIEKLRPPPQLPSAPPNMGSELGGTMGEWLSPSNRYINQ